MAPMFLFADLSYKENYRIRCNSPSSRMHALIGEYFEARWRQIIPGSLTSLQDPNTLTYYFGLAISW
jgi:hypothetical protein